MYMSRLYDHRRNKQHDLWRSNFISLTSSGINPGFVSADREKPPEFLDTRSGPLAAEVLYRKQTQTPDPRERAHETEVRELPCIHPWEKRMTKKKGKREEKTKDGDNTRSSFAANVSDDHSSYLSSASLFVARPARTRDPSSG